MLWLGGLMPRVGPEYDMSSWIQRNLKNIGYEYGWDMATTNIFCSLEYCVTRNDFTTHKGNS